MDLDSLDLYSGIPVRDLDRAVEWYSRLFGAEPFLPNDTEAVWDLAEHRSVYVALEPERAGGTVLLALFVADLDSVVAEIASRGIEPVRQETYGNGVRKITYRDPDSNELGFGGGPLDAS